MDTRKIKKLIDLLEESDVTEIEIREGEDYVRISRGRPAPVMAAPMAYAPAPAAPAQPAAAPAAPAAVAEPAGHLVRSPMVGTFYRSPSPGSGPFVESARASRPAM
jgi:acetyl-CoA carboxylase biotin carboxyl carrier protein